jgi:hypothetical protein
MKRLILLVFSALALLLPSVPLQAQGNIDWEELWVVPQPPSTNGPYGWMAGQRQYTGLAYDKWRDVVYIVNPGLCTIGGTTYYCPKIHIWDANTGTPATTVGRAASGVLGLSAGQGGQLSTALDTIVTSIGWGGGYGSFSQGQFEVYKVDLDDEGRIFVGNVVSPVWGICFPGPPPNCDPIYLFQGPYRIYRWDNPWASPKRVYATLRGNQQQIGTGIDDPPNAHVLSEMTWTRWGDAFDVVGKRNWVNVPGKPEPQFLDSARIFVSGGAFSGQSETNREICVILGDTRETPKISNGNGGYTEYRIGVRLISSLEGIASHGIAATGYSAIDEIWMDNNNRVTTLNNQGQDNSPLPQDRMMTRNHSLSSDEITGTGFSGPLAWFGIPDQGWKFLVCADGFPTNPNDPTAPNNRTRARVLNVTTTGQEFREPGLGDTPQLGQKTLTPNSGLYNYIADVDWKLEPDTSGTAYHLVLFVMMSNNGIGCYRSRRTIKPVELTTFHAFRNLTTIDLTWEVTSELNNMGFDVERSFNGGRNWEKIGFVNGRGSNPTPKRYTFDDPITPTHTSLASVMYRLRQVDTDGAFYYSPTATVFMGETPNTIELSQNYPNPFNPSTTISYQLAQSGFVTLKVFNAVGEEVSTLVNEHRDPGTYAVSFTAEGIPSGTYLYQLNVDGRMQQKKMVLMK